MIKRNFTPWGALHPILFFSGVYVVALIFSIFICSSLFYSCRFETKKTGLIEVHPKSELASLLKKDMDQRSK